MACMKALVGGFVEQLGMCFLHNFYCLSMGRVRVTFPATDPPKRKPSSSLAPYDIELLEAWYDAIRTAHGV